MHHGPQHSINLQHTNVWIVDNLDNPCLFWFKVKILNCKDDALKKMSLQSYRQRKWKTERKRLVKETMQEEIFWTNLSKSFDKIKTLRDGVSNRGLTLRKAGQRIWTESKSNTWRSITVNELYVTNFSHDALHYKSLPLQIFSILLPIKNNWPPVNWNPFSKEYHILD